jgi:hypothetical protein
MRLVTSAAVLMLLTGAHAQDGAPDNVNDCTFLNNPVELRDCIVSFEQWRSRAASSESLHVEDRADVTGSIVAPRSVVSGGGARMITPRVLRPQVPLTPSEKTRMEQIKR